MYPSRKQTVLIVLLRSRCWRFPALMIYDLRCDTAYFGHFDASASNAHNLVVLLSYVDQLL